MYAGIQEAVKDGPGHAVCPECGAVIEGMVSIR